MYDNLNELFKVCQMESSQSRAERLKALKLAKNLLETEESGDGNQKPILKFRNYEVRDTNIEHTKVSFHKSLVCTFRHPGGSCSASSHDSACGRELFGHSSKVVG